MRIRHVLIFGEDEGQHLVLVLPVTTIFGVVIHWHVLLEMNAVPLNYADEIALHSRVKRVALRDAAFGANELLHQNVYMTAAR